MTMHAALDSITSSPPGALGSWASPVLDLVMVATDLTGPQNPWALAWQFYGLVLEQRRRGRRINPIGVTYSRLGEIYGGAK